MAWTAPAGTFLERMGAAMKQRDAIDEALKRVSAKLNDEGIDYAIVGAMALAAHGHYRFSTDVDILTTPEGLDAVHRLLVGRGYVPSFPGARKRLRDTQTGVTIEFIVTGEYPGDGKPKPVVFPVPADASVDFEGIRVISLPKLIELKLASGLTGKDREKDIFDVRDLVHALKLPRELGEQVDASVRDEYYRIWDAAENAWDPSR